MIKENRQLRIMITCGSRIPTVELAAIIPFSLLQKQGVCEFHYKDEKFLSLADIVWCDILFLVRGASSQSVWIANAAKKLQRIVLGYWDDDLLTIPTDSLSYNYFSSSQIKKNINRLFNIIDFFFSPNPKLATKLSSIHGSEVKVLPGVLGAKKLRVPVRRIHGVPIVGYAGGRDHTKIVNSFLGPVLKTVIDKDLNCKIHIVGPRPKFGKELKNRIKYNAPIRNYYDYLDFASRLHWDIGLAPQVNNEFTTYKFYNKLLEYTSIGCAGIYSKLEPYTEVIQDGITGLLVDNEVDAWSDAIIRLLKDPELRFKIALNAYEFVQNSHNRKLIAEKYISALEPYVNYRAPVIKKPYIYFITVPLLFLRGFNLVIEDLRVYGVFAVIRGTLGYLFRQIFPKHSKVKKVRA